MLAAQLKKMGEESKLAIKKNRPINIFD